jgi:hypothetical protein
LKSRRDEPTVENVMDHDLLRAIILSVLFVMDIAIAAVFILPLFVAGRKRKAAGISPSAATLDCAGPECKR